MSTFAPQSVGRACSAFIFDSQDPTREGSLLQGFKGSAPNHVGRPPARYISRPGDLLRLRSFFRTHSNSGSRREDLFSSTIRVLPLLLRFSRMILVCFQDRKSV